jgi:putative ABC transport system permease protein
LESPRSSQGGINGRVGAAISAAVGALVVLFTMILVTRERTREIGILKAIGASNSNVAGLFTAETIGLATVGGLLGLLIYVAGGNLLVTIFIGSLGADVKGSIAYTLTWSDVSSSLLLVFFFGILGSIYPVFNAVRMRPSDAIRQR